MGPPHSQGHRAPGICHRTCPCRMSAEGRNQQASKGVNANLREAAEEYWRFQPATKFRMNDPSVLDTYKSMQDMSQKLLEFPLSLPVVR